MGDFAVSASDWQAIAFYFMVYSFGGWLLENTYSLATTGRFFKEGFLRGPLKPMYGFAPVILLLYAASEPSLGGLMLMCLLVPSAVEYASGYLLQRLFHKQWWDYSGHRFQLQGHICLRFSVYWLVLSFAVIESLHPSVAALYAAAKPIWSVVCPLFLLYLAVDTAYTVRTRFKQGLSALQNE